jgi:hypothetical protein
MGLAARPAPPVASLVRPEESARTKPEKSMYIDVILALIALISVYLWASACEFLNR